MGGFGLSAASRVLACRWAERGAVRASDEGVRRIILDQDQVQPQLYRNNKKAEILI